ncbi:MAG TPA: TadE/TadG family type IV pilus assembly protein [Sphingomicrobium sp.]|nr:TadE/TadG family type IV pilus assembly protein [Sphingomicrobium sp.]
MSRRSNLRRDERGAAALEMALATPVLVTMIYGIFTLGQVFEAQAGMQHAMGEGARYGTLCLSISSSGCTLPTSTQLRAKVSDKLFGTRSGTFDTPVVDTTTAPSGYVTVTVTYHQIMNFLLFTGPNVTLTRSKRVYLPDTPPTSALCSSPPSGTTAPASCSIYS